MAFSLGAFQDALWIRRDRSRSASIRPVSFGSAIRCELGMSLMTLLALGLALLLPNVRRIIEPSPYSSANDLVTISRAGFMGARFPTVRLTDYRSWAANSHHLFTELAFYQPMTRRVHTERHRSAELSIIRASANLFDVAELPMPSSEALRLHSGSGPWVVLSRTAWQSYFHGDPQITRRVLMVAGQQAAVVGLIADDDWRLPGNADLWLLENDRDLSALPSRTEGFVVAHVAPSSFSAPDGRREMTVFRNGGRYDVFDCVSLAERARQPGSIFLFSLLLACLALPATTSLPLGEYPARRDRLPWGIAARRWVFLATKIAWIVAIVYCASLDASYFTASISSSGSQYIQLATSFFAFLFSFRWALRDQRRRCPVCLRSLTNPAHVGQSSRNFLAWNGTELVCLGGHGLLHVPDLPTSWFSTQRWLYLDPSWSGLFSGGYAVSSGVV